MLITSLFQDRFKLIGVLSCVALLAACGGGGKTSVSSSGVQWSAASSASVVTSSASSLSVSSTSSSVSPDVTPDAFSFTPVLGAPTNSSITSTSITISGINTATPISITHGQYAIDGGAPTSDAGTITNGQTVTVTLLTSTTAGATTQAVLTVGGVAGAFSATTVNLMGGAIQGAPLNIATVVTTLAGAAQDVDGVGLTARFLSPSGITSDGTNLYVADTGNSKIRKIEIETGIVTTLAGNGFRSNADGLGMAASFYNPRGITSDGTSLYITDTGNNKIRKIVIATGVVTTLAGSGSYSDVDGTGAAASFNRPSGITNDGTNLYIADTGNNKIRKIVIATGVVTTLAGGGPALSADGTGTAASFMAPEGITSDGTSLYVAETNNHRIRKIVIATGVVTTLAGRSWSGWEDGTGTAASFTFPTDITNDGTNLYVTDTNNLSIRKIVIATGVVTTLAGSHSQGNIDGTGSAASFAYPQAITNDGTHLYVADTNNQSIRKIVIATGTVTTLAGGWSAGRADGAGTAASFNRPSGITSDGTNLYVTDIENHNIRKIVIATGVVTTLAGGGSEGNVDGTGTAASFNIPRAITTDGTNLYVADTQNHKVRKIVIATGFTSTLAGSGFPGNVDGTGSVASFYQPSGITSDGANLYIADTGNNKIRKVVIATGVVTTLAGGGLSDSVDGIGTAASFYAPRGITSDGTNLYITDRGNHKIRKIAITTGVVTTLAGSGLEGSTDGTGTAASFKFPEGITSDGFELFVTDSANNTIRTIH